MVDSRVPDFTGLSTYQISDHSPDIQIWLSSRPSEPQHADLTFLGNLSLARVRLVLARILLTRLFRSSHGLSAPNLDLMIKPVRFRWLLWPVPSSLLATYWTKLYQSVLGLILREVSQESFQLIDLTLYFRSTEMSSGEWQQHRGEKLLTGICLRTFRLLPSDFRECLTKSTGSDDRKFEESLASIS